MAKRHRGIRVDEGLGELLSRVQGDRTLLEKYIREVRKDLTQTKGSKAPTDRSLDAAIGRWYRNLISGRPVHVQERYRFVLSRVFAEIAPGEENPFEITTVETPLEEGHSNAPRRELLNQLFMEYVQDYEYERDIRGAVSVALLGTNMRRIVQLGRISLLTKFLDEISSKGTRASDANREHGLRILMHHPNADETVLKTSMIQDLGGIGVLRDYRKLIFDNLGVFCELRERYGPDKVKVRFTEYMPAVGLDVFSYSKLSMGVVYVRYYPIPNPYEDHKDKPIMRLTPLDGNWYKFFKNQFERHWELVGEDVPLDYDWRPPL